MLMSSSLFKDINHITCETVNAQPYLYIEYYRNTAINNNFASKEDLNSVENTANAAYSQAQSTTIVYTTTITANTPGESAIWTESLPAQTDK